MACEKRLNYYICGSNLHGQISQICEINCIDNNALFITKPLALPEKKGKLKFGFTWSQLWTLADKKKLTCYGFNKDKMQEGLQKLRNCTKQVVPLQQTTLIETTEGIYLVSEDCSMTKIFCEANCKNVSLLHGTNKIAVGIDDTGQLWEATLNSTIEDKGTVKCAVFEPFLSNTVATVTCGLEHILILSTDGELYSYGSNSRGQLGHGELSVDEVNSPKLVSTLEGINVTSASAGGWHSVVVTVDGDIYVWGWNDKGQLGLPSSNLRKRDKKQNFPRSTSSIDRLADTSLTDQQGKKRTVMDIPLEIHQKVEPILIQTHPYGLDIPDDLKVKKAACGTRHTCLLLECGVVMTCGWNSYGQLGHGNRDDCDFLKTVCYIADRGLIVKDIDSGAWNTVIVTETDIT